ncbi:MAG: hypothetical protein QOH49_1372 [Acidobacteriota bacterium]|jgi:hypothetical protein|nr:hypothetical protein [Acidobacteriota bacterium]
MSDETMSCIRCGGAMEEGILMGMHAAQLKWVQGVPETGMFGRVKVYEKQIFSVATFRCVKCGQLESFARESVPS